MKINARHVQIYLCLVEYFIIYIYMYINPYPSNQC